MSTLTRTATALLLIGLLAACATSPTGFGAARLGVTSKPEPGINSNPQPPLAPIVGLLFF